MLLGCTAAAMPPKQARGTFRKNILQNLRNKWPPHPVDKLCTRLTVRVDVGSKARHLSGRRLLQVPRLLQLVEQFRLEGLSRLEAEVGHPRDDVLVAAALKIVDDGVDAAAAEQGFSAPVELACHQKMNVREGCRKLQITWQPGEKF